MHKNRDTGYWEDDFRREQGAWRWHISYGETKKTDALPLAAVALALVKSRNDDVIDEIRTGARTIHEVARLVAEGKPIVQLAPAPSAEPDDTAWPTVRAACVEYLEWIATNPRKSEGTHAAASTQLNRFLEWLGADADGPLDAITTKRVSEYQAAMYKAGAAQNTVIAYVWRVGSVFRWHRDTELRDAQEAKRPARQLHVPLDPDTVATKKTARDRWLSEPEAERLLLAAPARLLCPVAIGLFAGLRVDEVLHLRPAFDVDLDTGLLIVQPQPGGQKGEGWSPKNRKRRFVPIAPPLRPLLETHLERYASEDWLTPAMRDPSKPFNRHTFDLHFFQIVGDAELVQGRTDPKGVVFHTLRHTFASWLIARGVDLYTVAQLLGNSLKQVEQVYGHLAPDFKAAAIKKLEGAVVVPEYPELPTPTSEPAIDPVYAPSWETTTGVGA